MKILKHYRKTCKGSDDAKEKIQMASENIEPIISSCLKYMLSKNNYN